MAMQSQQERMQAVLAAGQWVPNERFIEMHIPDYRKRMSELRERFPGRYAKRMRTRKRPDGSSYIMADWLDQWATETFDQAVRPQLVVDRAHTDLAGSQYVVVEWQGQRQYVMLAQLDADGIDATLADLRQRFTDPWLGVGVRP